jgi:small-conductance mechanosensitive channel
MTRLMGRAQASVSRLRGSLLALALSAFLLLLFTGAEAVGQVGDAGALPEQGEPAAASADLSSGEVQPPLPSSPRASDVARGAQAEAVRTVDQLRHGFLTAAPKLAVALGTLLLAWLFTRAARRLLRALLGGWQRTSAITALLAVGAWLLAGGVALSVLAGDIRALAGSVGLVGLALSWALQRPIESFTGWLLNSFQGYYRVGDRISVADAFGDVQRIDLLTTTLWEIGSPSAEGAIKAEQPTGRLITFPNSEVLLGMVVNLTRLFPYVWDELTLPFANETDLRRTREVLTRVADEVVGVHMAEPAGRYQEILTRHGLEVPVSARPQLFISLATSWLDVSIRYLVDARQRRVVKSALLERLLVELASPEHAGQIVPALPRQQVQLVGEEWLPNVSDRVG